MKVDKETLHKVAHLARLHVKPEEEEKLQEDMSKILTWVAKLDELNTEGVEPQTHMTFEKHILREDIPKTEITTEQALKNAPKHNKDYFEVPKVLKRNS